MFSMRKDPKVAFYSGSAVHSVLKRYAFSDEEKKIIQAAILTARKEKPKMSLIDEADALLKTVSSTRDPLPEVEDKVMIQKAQLSHSLAQANLQSKSDDRRGKATIYFAIAMFALALLTMQLTKSYQARWATAEYGQHTYDEAVEICQHHRDSLPTVVQLNEIYEESSIVGKATIYLANTPYWIQSADTPMTYRTRDEQAQNTANGDLYDVLCVDDTNSFF